MYCIKCGSQLKDGYVFCPVCGATNQPVPVQPSNGAAPYGNAPQPAPYGNAPQPMPYGNAPQPMPYGNAPQPMPYGNAPQPAPYGNAPQPAPYGNAPQPMPYGNAPQPMPYGSAPQPAPFTNTQQPTPPPAAPQPETGSEHTVLLEQSAPAVEPEPEVGSEHTVLLEHSAPAVEPEPEVGSEHTVLLEQSAPAVEPEPEVGSEHTVLLEQSSPAVEPEPEVGSEHTVLLEQSAPAAEPEPFKPSFQPYTPDENDQATVFAGDDFPAPPSYEERSYRSSSFAGAVPPPVANRQYDAPKTRESKPEKKQRVYRKTPVGIRILSIFLCLLLFTFGSITILLASLRITFKEDHVRDACRDGSIADITVYTDGKSRTLSEVIAENLVESDKSGSATIDRLKIEAVLRKAYVADFVETIATQYTNYLFNNQAPTKLNADEVIKFLERVSEDLNKECGYRISKSYLNEVKEKINGGNMSFLSIDSTGGAFKQKYGVDPHLFTLFVSVLAVIICAAVALVFLVLIIVINRKNLPAGLLFNGITLTVLGGIHLLMGAAALIFSMVKKIYIVSVLAKYFAIGMGSIGLAILVIGVLMIIFKKILSKNAVVQ